PLRRRSPRGTRSRRSRAADRTVAAWTGSRRHPDRCHLGAAAACTPRSLSWLPVLGPPAPDPDPGTILPCPGAARGQRAVSVRVRVVISRTTNEAPPPGSGGGASAPDLGSGEVVGQVGQQSRLRLGTDDLLHRLAVLEDD